jgi:hypothetical protein
MIGAKGVFGLRPRDSTETDYRHARNREAGIPQTNLNSSHADLVNESLAFSRGFYFGRYLSVRFGLWI